MAYINNFVTIIYNTVKVNKYLRRSDKAPYGRNNIISRSILYIILFFLRHSFKLSNLYNIYSNYIKLYIRIIRRMCNNLHVRTYMYKNLIKSNNIHYVKFSASFRKFRLRPEHFCLYYFWTKYKLAYYTNKFLTVHKI